MVQTMEAWIVADVDALKRYYGQNFNTGLLPRATDLESVAKSEVEDSLRRATKHAGKGGITRSGTRATCCSGSLPRR